MLAALGNFLVGAQHGAGEKYSLLTPAGFWAMLFDHGLLVQVIEVRAGVKMMWAFGRHLGSGAWSPLSQGLFDKCLRRLGWGGVGWGTLAKTVEYPQRLAEERCRTTWLVHPSANGCLGGADWPSEVRGAGPAPGGMAGTNASNQLIHLFPRRVGGLATKRWPGSNNTLSVEVRSPSYAF